MKAPGFKKWLAALPTLNQPQRIRVLAALRPAAGLHQLLALIEQVRGPGRRCPHCCCSGWHRHGHANGLQRYRCRQCRRTYNDLTGTPLARLRLRAKWLDYLDALRVSCPVRAAAEQIKVHRNTAFRWRHRFLDRAKDNRPACLHGIAEADEMFLLESQKGSRKLDRAPRKRGGVAAKRGISRELDCILVARDRSGQTIDAVTGRGALNKAQLERHLLPCLDRQVLLVTDAHAAYRAFARAHGIAHQAVNLRAGQRTRREPTGAIHVQNVNAYHHRFREWLARFHGVASHYLPNYLGWRRALDGGKVTCADQLLRLAIGSINSER
ncbi:MULTISPECIES: IS1595 family transposase [unclassified Massilia]|uniref:IS1595 family transposase n=1 Tax=unclassified Massilia TaxID=2609279 RepID=UPI00177E2CC6|nr:MULTISPECIES: IS1595 family transposase [unclassified Massilia]MBD8532350.1 IS1595 family transposase [Massilia sp. CFBP 13647]MBD8673777.1 IS1595 family transposase [Massilia sp. CFBP 13721]